MIDPMDFGGQGFHCHSHSPFLHFCGIDLSCVGHMISIHEDGIKGLTVCMYDMISNINFLRMIAH